MTDLNIELLDWQQDCLNDPSRFKVIAAGDVVARAHSGGRESHR